MDRKQKEVKEEKNRKGVSERKPIVKKIDKKL